MLTFALSDDQRMVQDQVRKFAAEELRPRHREMEKAGGVPSALQKTFDGMELGLVDVPEALGGLGLGTLTACLIHEELAHGDPGAAVALWAPHFVPAALMELASPAEATRILGVMRRGALAWTGNVSARRGAEGFILDGTTAPVVNGGAADVHVVFSNDEAYVVLGTQPGMIAGARAEWVGLETVEVRPLELREVPASRLDAVTAPGVRRMFARMSLVTAARQVGLARASAEYALAYTQDRVAFGKPVAHFQAIAFNLAEMLTEVDSARWMVWRAAVAFDKGEPDAVRWAAKAAWQANDVAWRVADDGVQLLGGAGFIQDHPAEKWLRDTRALSLLGQTDEVSQMIVAGEAEVPTGALQPVVT